MYNPVSTYRVQLNSRFTFAHLKERLPFLHTMGFKTIYASPIFEAIPGSTHGYDVTNPHKINPEIGTEQELRELVQSCHDLGMGWVQDIVPNHMAYHINNRWLMDVLEKGKMSLYADMFDIDLQEQLMFPFLGESEESLLHNGKINVGVDDTLFLSVNDARLPLNAFSYGAILKLPASNVPAEIDGWLQQLHQLSLTDDKKDFTDRWNDLICQFTSLTQKSENRHFIALALGEVNSSITNMHLLLADQHYRLCEWNETDKHINYRRFFIVNALICLNMQTPEVFKFYHRYILSLTNENLFDGLRIDHVDGLNDPTCYIHDLRKELGAQKYIVVEKILEPGEQLKKEWSVQGTTGYEFLAAVNNLTGNADGIAVLDRFYKDNFNNRPVDELTIEKKSAILHQHMCGELDNLCNYFYELGLAKEAQESFSQAEMKAVLASFIIHCPVYRYYGNSFPLKSAERRAIASLFTQVRKQTNLSVSAIDYLSNLLLNKHKTSEERSGNICSFYKRCMQFTGPLMAKGVEDTLMYTYARFLSHNEVGDHVSASGWGAERFHKEMIARQRAWPLALNATSTHDTKRGEDARARLNVIPSVAPKFIDMVNEWRIENAGVTKASGVHANDEYFIYQTLSAHYPFSGDDKTDFEGRFITYMQKALREGKANSSWSVPNVQYEDGVTGFIRHLLKKIEKGWSSFQQLHEVLSAHGAINSLTQLILKFTCPGVPDTYNGCEGWDFAFVDPDNRREVDYPAYLKWLQDIAIQPGHPSFINELLQNRLSGNVKLWLTGILLKLRNEDPAFFAEGAYIPLQVSGTYSHQVIAFMRKYKSHVLIVALPLHTAGINPAAIVNFNEVNWQDTIIHVPEDIYPVANDVFSNGSINIQQELKVSDAFSLYPYCLLKAKLKASVRSAGLLMHITSLPSSYGIGDFGPGAYAFADFLKRSNQKVWQLLPLTPIEKYQGWSPYSSICSRAGNIYLISPALLHADGLVDEDTINALQIPSSDTVNYDHAAYAKNIVLKKAWETFRMRQPQNLAESFDAFKLKEDEWLHDFALYAVLKEMHQHKAWFDWAEIYKWRNREALQSFSAGHVEQIEKIKFFQYLFFNQWERLHNYCKQSGIQMFGDLPFYVGHDSVDVWANPEIFSLDEEGQAVYVAGVPPDLFSADGQLWGMPVYRWDVLKEKGYDWWIKRLNTNFEIFDLLRLDHFRAFASYWQVDANETTAKNGEWKDGPGEDFFNTIDRQFGLHRLVAEDLGDITPDVYELRDRFKMPGMQVLQFAFMGYTPGSVHLPHQHRRHAVTYTGTHDNNTTLGWYKNELIEKDRHALSEYLGHWVKEEEVVNIVLKMAYASVADTTIIPLQDLLYLDQHARMNKPSVANNNWSWRMTEHQLNAGVEDHLKHLTGMYNRGGIQ